MVHSELSSNDPGVMWNRPERDQPQETLSLDDGKTPVWMALVDAKQLAMGVIKTHEANTARDNFRKCLEIDEAAVMECRGKSAAEANHILNGILGRGHN